MDKRLYLFFLFAIAVGLYLYECYNMYSVEIVDSVVSKTPIIPIVLLFLPSLTALLLSPKQAIGSKLAKRFTYCMLLNFFLSVFFSLFYPIGSSITYITILLPLFLFYFTYISSQYIKTKEVIIWIMTVVFIMILYYYLNTYSNNVFYDNESASNSSYPLLYLLPFMLCHKKRLFRVIAIVLTVLVVSLSLKRGGFIAIIFSIVIYLLIFQKAVNNKRSRTWLTILLLLFSVGVYYFIDYTVNSIAGGLLYERFAEDDVGGSGRMSLYSRYFNLLLNGTPIDWLFGHGWCGSLRASNSSLTCHNDFLESIIDFGIFGFLLYVSLYVQLIRVCRQMVKSKNVYAPAMGASIAIFFVNSLVSHILIYPHYLILFSLFWGFIVSNTKYDYSKQTR